MSNISSGNSSTAGAEEEYEEQDQQQTSNVLLPSSVHQKQDLPNKKRRKLPGNPDPSSEVIALSPKTLMATNRFICEVCNKGFQREQNLQLHRRGHNLPWKLKQKTSSDEIRKRRVYICPEPTCIHHNPARALGDLTGIKKHYSRKHGEKKWKCDKCSKKYAVQSDWKAHSKTCGTKEYKCDCGTIFSRRDSFVTHRAFCDALTEENNKVNQSIASTTGPSHTQVSELMSNSMFRNSSMKIPMKPSPHELNIQTPTGPLAGSMFTSPRNLTSSSFSGFQLSTNSSNMSSSATALLQQAAQMGATVSSSINSSPIMVQKGYPSPFQTDQEQTQTGTSVHGFFGSMLQNGTQETLISQLLNSNSSTAGDHHQTISRMQNQGWYSGLFNETKINGESGKDSLTLDFLGIGGMRQRNNSHEMHQQQQEMSFEQQKEMTSMWDDREDSQKMEFFQEGN